MRRNMEKIKKLLKKITTSKLRNLNFRKLEPSDIMKFIQEMKNKVNCIDIYDMYQNFCSKMGNFDQNNEEYLKIK